MGLTLDTGAVIALEESQRGRTSERRLAFMRAIAEPDGRLERVRVTIPSVVIAEWWRARPGQPWGSIVETDYRIEMFDAATAKVVGALLERSRSPRSSRASIARRANGCFSSTLRSSSALLDAAT